MFGNDVPSAVAKGADILMLLITGLLMVWGLFFVVAKIRKLWRESIRPMLYDAAARRRAEDRRRFALHLKAQLDSLNAREAWQDFRFSELEAEVEAEGRRSARSVISFVRGTRSGLRRERSLSAALKGSHERLILLEGEPGSGKSVALRHVAALLLGRVATARSVDSIVPIYINLKDLRRLPYKEVDRNVIEAYVLEKMAGNDRNVERFLEEEFQRGMRDGTWLFLFDSFDEIPDIISSTEADETINQYAEAIKNFLYGMNKCRGIVASRSFRGPRQLAWPRFRIKQLSRERQRALVRRVNLDRQQEKRLLGWLDAAPSELRRMTSNPMFLGLVANHVENHHDFPESPHGVFDSYVTRRFEQDEERIFQRYKLNRDELRLAAEHLAFSMAADDGLGLNPSRDRLRQAMERLGFQTVARIPQAMNALEYIKLARSETDEPGDPESFTFAHRRFQEYFSTCVLLREPDRVSPRQLLTDARWREAVVVMCQTQEATDLAPIVAAADRLVNEIARIQQHVEDNDAFSWPPGVMHLCSILQDGFGARLDDLPDGVRKSVGRLLKKPFDRGTALDRKWALDVAGAAPASDLQFMVQVAFQSGNQWLRDSAYRQVSRLDKISPTVSNSIRETLIFMGKRGILSRERFTTAVYLARLDRSSEFLATLRHLLWVPRISAILHLGLATWVIVYLSRMPSWGRPSSYLVLFFATALCLASARTIWDTSRPFVETRRNLVIWALLFSCSPAISPILRLEAPVFVPHYARMAWVVFIAYVLLWPTLNIQSARFGQYSSPIYWPAVPLAVLIENSRSALRTVLASLPKVFVVILFTIMLGSLLRWLDKVLSEQVFSVALHAFVAASGVLFTLLVLRKLAPLFRDNRRYKRFADHQSASMSGTEFNEITTSFWSSAFAVRFINSVRGRDILVPDADSLGVLRNMIVEHEQRQSHEVLDSLCRLYEQTERLTGRATPDR